MADIPFLKMHGLGNDFVIIDQREQTMRLKPYQAAALADRHRGIGCDQVIQLEPPQSEGAELFMRIYNPDGSEAGACGNATRCVASLIYAEKGVDEALIETLNGLLPTWAARHGLISVDMGAAKFGWQDIPIAREMDTDHLEMSFEDFDDPVGLSMGNPHAVFFVHNPPDDETLVRAGKALEHNPLFPERANIQFVQVTGPDELRQRVWERGAGVTLASGSGACAGAVAAVRRGLIGRKVMTQMDGGQLLLEVRDDWHVVMTGPVATSFKGTVELSS